MAGVSGGQVQQAAAFLRDLERGAEQRLCRGGAEEDHQFRSGGTDFREQPGPTKGLPARSSASPGCSPIIIAAALRGPAPNTVWVASTYNAQPRQFAAADASLVRLRPPGT
ncbi:hypothetical protein GCM10009754_64840 [Amycolatopsis minnesotensis]|uniref:Uncharacterized protein n=1 Tax=Amycolatopsis minnesotensis TaxID=337894 RepID=A0ABN2S344_9PSEU